MFSLKTTIEEEMMEHIRDAKTPKEAWDTLVTFYSKKNDTRLQLLKNRLQSIAQCDMRIAQYFHKVKSIRCKISKLDPTTALGDARKIKENNYTWFKTPIPRVCCHCTVMENTTITCC